MTSLCLFLSMEEDFVTWREQFWPAVCEHFGVEATGDESRYVKLSFDLLLMIQSGLEIR